MREPIVQIVHYSDMHLASGDYTTRRQLLKRFERLLPANWKQGIAGADTAALRAFARYLREDLSVDPVWKQRPTWLVDTGDGTTFGDPASLAEWLKVWSARFLQAMAPNAQQVVLYGNHDAWPGTFPLLAPFKMATQRDDLRRTRFKGSWPLPPLTADIPGSNGLRVELYVANTVDHRALQNAAALGVAAPDRWWEDEPPMAGPTPADDIRRLVLDAPDQGHGSRFRILATHYPVRDPESARQFFEVLSNRAEFGRGLAGRPGGHQPLVHVLLSGHRHQVFPASGALPADLADADHSPLPRGVCQMQSASLSQLQANDTLPASESAQPSLLSGASIYPFQCTLLRLYKIADAPLKLLVERRLVVRDFAGDFFVLRSADDNQDWVEQMHAAV
jgi:hypothetical protein